MITEPPIDPAQFVACVQPLLVEIVKFFQTKQPPVSNDETLEIFAFMDAAQRSKAAHYKAALDKSGAFPHPIVTAIEPYKNFYAAENYHQNYFNNNGDQPYCQFVIRPKVEKFQKVFKNKLRHN